MSLVLKRLSCETDKTPKQVEDKKVWSHTFISHTSAWQGALLSTGASLPQRSGSRTILSTTQIAYHIVLAIQTAMVLTQHAVAAIKFAYETSLGCGPGLGIQGRLRSIQGYHRNVLDPRDVTLWIRFNWPILTASTNMGGSAECRLFTGRPSTTASFLRNKIKSRVSIFSHCIYTLYLISSLVQRKIESLK
jgi:hypothetical protein